MRKPRYWRCDRCYMIYTRRKSERGVIDCRFCRGPMVKTTRFPDDAWWAKRDKKRGRERRLREQSTKKWSKPRDSHQRRLILSREVKRLWKAVEKARRLDSLERRATQFVNAIHGCIHRLGINGMVHPPKVIVNRQPPQYDTLGEYTRGLLRGRYDIQLWTRELDAMKLTLLHEVQHHIDAEAKVPKEYSDHHSTFYTRLERLKKDLRVRLKKAAKPGEPQRCQLEDALVAGKRAG